ncbi:ABC transporter permease [Ignisphaera sp. 4213-co]|uniref:ABC transporter permease n=1 Tax=Ignisphaera cupida TaxID=3050454 RepID=A0ABD4Z7Y1_9CREN|nr:ABC transporter permease [Ignisphaera sp. 4213-co]MDK6029451.1 ABC transporter permease [Ignisphaera sp. 4213-co]
MSITSFYKSDVISSLKPILKILARGPARIFSLFIILLYVVLGIGVVVGFIPSLPPYKGGLEYVYQPPSTRDFPWYILGTEYTGRPLLLTLIHGIPKALSIAFLAAIITVSVGMVLGLAAGYIGGWVDEAISVAINIALTIPTYLLALIILMVIPEELKQNIFILAGILSITAWASLARAVRAQTLSLKRREFVDVAKTLGFSTWKIIFGEIIRFIAPFLAMNLVLGMVGAIYGYTGLAFLGFMPMTPDNWGVQIYMAIRGGGALYSDKAILALWSPIITIVLLQYALINIADALGEVFNPALRIGLRGEET